MCCRSGIGCWLLLGANTLNIKVNKLMSPGPMWDRPRTDFQPRRCFYYTCRKKTGNSGGEMKTKLQASPR